MQRYALTLTACMLVVGAVVALVDGGGASDNPSPLQLVPKPAGQAAGDGPNSSDAAAKAARRADADRGPRAGRGAAPTDGRGEGVEAADPPPAAATDSDTTPAAANAVDDDAPAPAADGGGGGDDAGAGEGDD